MDLNEFNGPYPAKCEAFLCGRIIHRLFFEEVGIPVPKGFNSSLGFGKNNETKILFENNRIYYPFSCLKEIIVLNTRLGILEMDSQIKYDIIMKWAEKEGIE